MKIACTLALALLVTAANGLSSSYVNPRNTASRLYGWGSYGSSAVAGRPWGGRFGGTGYTNYNAVPSAAASAASYYTNTASAYPAASQYLANAYYNPSSQYTASSQYASSIYNPASQYTGTNLAYQYASNAYNPTSQFVGSTLANQYLASATNAAASATTGNVCPNTAGRTIIVSDYIKYGVVQTFNCIGACVFQPNSVLSAIERQNYDKADVVVVMAGPYSYPNSASTVLNNASMLAALAARTNLYLSTIPVRPTVTDATILANTASANALVRSAASATPGANVIDYQAFYNSYVRYNENQWMGLEMCNWIRQQIPTPTATAAVTPAPTTVVAGTLAPF